MLNFERQNYHHSKIPARGEIVIIAGLHGNPLNGKKCIVSHYPLNDNADHRYTRGIHCTYVRILATGELVRIAGQWLIDPDAFSDYRYHLAAGRLGLYDRERIAARKRRK